MDNFILIHSNAVPDEICEYFIDTFEKEDKSGNTFPGHVGMGINKTLKDCTDCIIHRDSKEFRYLDYGV